MSLTSLSISELKAQLCSKAVSPVEVLESLELRIAQIDPKIGGYIFRYFDAARKLAETADVSHYNFPARSKETYGVHDRMAMLPGQLRHYGERWEGDECILEAEGRVVQAQAPVYHLQRYSEPSEHDAPKRDVA